MTNLNDFMRELTDQSRARCGGWVKAGLICLTIILMAGVAEAQTDFATAQDLGQAVFGTVTNDNMPQQGQLPDIGAPDIAGFFPNSPLWYKWTAPKDGDVELDTVGSVIIETNQVFVGFDTNNTPLFSTNVETVNLDTVLGVYSGTNVAYLNQVAANDDLFPINESNPQFNESPDTENTSDAFITQKYYGPSHLRFTAKGGQTYYFAVDTKFGYGNLHLSWAYKSSGVFRFATEDYDPSTGMPLYQAAETESLPQSGTSGHDANSVNTTYYPYNAPGCLVTVTRTAGSVGRVVVHYETEDGTNLAGLPSGDLPAVAGVDYQPVSGDLVFDDFEMSKTILVPIIYHQVMVPFDQTNRVFGIKLTDDGGATSPQLDFMEDADVNDINAVSPPRVDPVFGEAMIKILNVNADPYGPDMIPVVSTNGVDDDNNPVLETNMVQAAYPTNVIFNFQKANYRVPADVNDSSISPYNYATVTLYVERFGTNTEAQTVYYRINNYLGENNSADEINNDFPLQPGSDYAVPTPATIGGARGTNSDFDVADGSLSFPATGGSAVFYQPIHITIPLTDRTRFNKDFRIQLYRMVKVGDNTVPRITGMNAETTVTILFNDENPPAGSVDEFYNADFNSGMATLPSKRPTTVPQDDPNPGVAGEVYSIAVLTNDEALLGGDFVSYDGIGRNSVALVSTNGQLDTSFYPGDGANGPVDAVAVSGNQFFIGGDFSSYDGSLVGRIARLNADGSLDTSFNPGNGADGVVRAIVALPDGKVLIGGDFTHINGTARNYIARLNADGTVDSTFDPSGIINGPVYALAVASTNSDFANSIMVGGNFTVTGQSYRNIARLNSDGSLDSTFTGAGSGVDGIVHALAWQSNDQIVAVGEFTHANGDSYNHIVRLNPDGSIDKTNFFIGTGADNAIFSVNIQTNGTIYIGGSFDSFNGTLRRGFARLYSNGTVDTTFMDTAYNQFAGLKKIYSYDSPAVFASAVQSDGGVLIGGSFNQVGGGQAYADVCNTLDDELSVQMFGVPGFILESFADPNLWVERKARDGVRNRSSFARLIGGATPGPGNLGLAATSGSANKSSSSYAVALVRTNGTLGPVSANFSILPGLATSGRDYSYFSSPPLYWIAWNYIINSTRMREDGLYGSSGLLTDALGYDLPLADADINNLSKVNVSIINNKANPGNLNAQFQLANPSLSDTFYLGGEAIPVGAALGVSSAPFTLIDDTPSPGQFGFSSASYVATNSSASITVVRSNGVSGIVSLHYSTTNGTALAGVDYRGITNRTLVFNQGVTSTNFTVTILNDGYITNVEKTVNLSLFNLGLTPGATFGISNAVLRLINPYFQGYVTLAATNFTGSINSHVLNFTVNRIAGSLGTVTVQYSTTSGPSATNGVDFIGSTNTLTWNNGDVSPKTVSIPLLDPGVVGGDKQFGVRLFNPTLNGNSSPDLMGIISNASLTISNDDSYGTLQLSAPSYLVNENGGYATITVVRSDGSSGMISVEYTTVDGTAVVSNNYVSTNGVLTLAPGQTTASFDVQILDDSIQDPANFYFDVTLSNPTNATLGSITNARVKIEDAESYNRPPGSGDTGFNSDGMNGNVFALAQNSSGQIIAGGGFTAVGPVAESHLARLNVNGGLDTGFMDGLSGPNAAVNAVVSQSNDRILIGGQFTSVDGLHRNFIARLMTDGSVDTSFNPGAGPDSVVNTIAETFVANGTNLTRKIYIGGAFGAVNGVSSPGFARLNDNGTVDGSFNVGAGADGQIYAIAVYPTNSADWGKVLIGGAFTHFDGTSITNLVRLNSDGSLDTNFNANLGQGPDGTVHALAVQLDGKVLVGGSFTNFNGLPINRIIRLNADGALDSSFASNTNGGANDTVEAIALQPDNRIIVAGQFTAFGGVTRNHITRLLPTGATDPAINFGSGANGDVDALLIQPADGMIVIGGAFSQYDGETHNSIARIYGGSVTGSGTFEFTSANFQAHEDAITAAVTIRRTGGTSGTNSDGSGDVLVHFNTSDGTAIDGMNYFGVSTDVDFPSGETLKTVLVPVLDDNVVTSNLTVNLALTNSAPSVKIGNQPTATLTILNDDNVVAFSSPTYTQVKNTPTGVANIDVLRLGGTNGTASVDFFTTTNGTAVTNIDYYPTNGTVTFNPGVSDVQIQVPIINNSLPEGNRTVELVLTNAVNTLLASPSNATLTIIDTVSAPGQLFFDATNYVVNEGDGTAYLTVLRTNGSSGSVSVAYTTVAGTAQPNANYTAVSGTLSFANGETSKPIPVPLVDNDIVQGTVNFSVDLSNPTGGSTLADSSSATVTIMDNDSGFAFLNATNYVRETNGIVPIFVQRIGGTNGNVSVNFATTNDGTAQVGTNYDPVSGTLTFTTNEMLKTISLPLHRDPLVTGNLTLGMNLFDAAGGLIGSPSNALIVIQDADAGLSFTNSTMNVFKNIGEATITVVCTNPAVEPVLINTNIVPLSVGFSTFDGTAVAGVDYIATNGVLVFTNGIGTNTFTVPIINNSRVTGNHTFNVSLFNPLPTDIAQVIGPSNLLVTIVDANAGFHFSSPVYTALKGIDVAATITVSREDNTNQTSSVEFATSDGSAAAGVDYFATNGVLVFTNGVTSRSFTVPVIANSTVQPDKTVLLQLYNPTNAYLIAPYAATLTIHDTTGSLVVPAGSALVHEGSIANGIIDPGENVTMLLALRASGGTNIASVNATLLTTNGVTSPSPSGPVNYGSLIVNGPSVSRQFSFTGNGTNGQQIAATLLINNGVTNIGTVEFTYMLGVWTNTFYNTNAIIIPDAGMASPYPSTITVTNLGGTLVKATVTLTNFSHTYPRDVNVLLVSPSARDTMLMSHAGGSTSASKITLTFDDSATNSLPQNGALTTSTNKPTSYYSTPNFP